MTSRDISPASRHLRGGSSETRSRGEVAGPPRVIGRPTAAVGDAYGNETLVLSPLFEMVKVPAEATGV